MHVMVCAQLCACRSARHAGLCTMGCAWWSAQLQPLKCLGSVPGYQGMAREYQLFRTCSAVPVAPYVFCCSAHFNCSRCSACGFSCSAHACNHCLCAASSARQAITTHGHWRLTCSTCNIPTRTLKAHHGGGHGGGHGTNTHQPSSSSSQA